MQKGLSALFVVFLFPLSLNAQVKKPLTALEVRTLFLTAHAPTGSELHLGQKGWQCESWFDMKGDKNYQYYDEKNALTNWVPYFAKNVSFSSDVYPYLLGEGESAQNLSQIFGEPIYWTSGNFAKIFLVTENGSLLIEFAIRKSLLPDAYPSLGMPEAAPYSANAYKLCRFQ